MKGFSATSRDLTRMETLLSRLDEAHRTHVCQLFHHLTVPPDLCYLRDGLKRTCAILERHGDELDRLLSRMRRPALRSAQLQSTARFLLDDAELWNVPPDHLLLAEMSGTANPADHPLHGYCFSVCAYWVILFFGTRNAGSRAPSTLADDFNELVAEVAVHIIAVNARKDANSYRGYCRKWKETRKRPSSSMTQGAARSRAAVAARVLGRLARTDWTDVLREFLGSRPGARLTERVKAADETWLFDEPMLPPEKNRMWVLENVALLLDTTTPGWRRKRRGPGNGGGGGGHGQRGPDGYVRLPSSRLLRDNQISFGEVALTVDVLPPAKPSRVEGLTPEDEGPEGDPSSSTTFPMVSMPTGGSSPAASGRLLASQASSLLRKLLGAPNTNFRNLSGPQLKRLSAALAEPGLGALPWRLEASVKAMLATGRDLRKTKIWVQPNLQHAKREVDEGDVQFAFAEEAWLFHLPPPAFKSSYIVPWEREHRRELVLPDHLGIAATLKQGFQRMDHSRTLTISPEGEHEIREWLQTATADDRPSIRSLSTFLFARLVQISRGDLGIATLLTGQSIAHARTTLHYSSYAISDVASAYRQALAPIKTAPGKRDAEPGHVGARRVPTRDTVTGVLCDLRALIHSRTDPADASLRANAYTAYTMAGLHLATAARPVVERVLLDGSDELGFVLLTEKARTPYDYRPVALPPTLHKQLREYLAFLRRHMPGWQPDDGLFFQYDSDGKSCGAFTPQCFRDLVKGLGYDMELYAFRRFDRTALVTRERVDGEDFEAEDIDALLGHWYERVSPHDPLSTYPPRRLRGLANGPIEGLLKSVGYVVIAPP